MDTLPKTAVIIGAGPAGLTAAYELLHRTDIIPVIYESTDTIGGIARTVKYKGNRIDMGGHRFFSKSERVTNWWLNILPLQGSPSRDDKLLGRTVPLSDAPGAPDPDAADKAMIIRNRLSRIFFLRKFFDYPISLSARTFMNLGPARVCRIGASYAKARLFPVKQEKSLEDFFVNRFGRELYNTFFRDYTEKVWGVPCDRIKPEWGAQRIKGLSISKAVWHAIKNIFAKDRSVGQKKTETSLIEQFMYPKFGPGQMWEEVADIIRAKGGHIFLNRKITGLKHDSGIVTAVTVTDTKTGMASEQKADYVFSTMPVKDLIDAFSGGVPEDVRSVAAGLMYRDFITTGLLLKKLKIRNETAQKTINNIIPDNWIYIQERDVKLGRLQVFNNWSPYMVREENTVWMGLEYFCNEGDELWSKTDEEFTAFAVDELAKIDIIDREDVLDSVVIRLPKTYPAYFGTYERFDTVRKFTDGFRNLFLIGRNGMHRYNNMDHSMLTAMTVVDNIAGGVSGKDNIWSVNAEAEYHETK